MKKLIYVITLLFILINYATAIPNDNVIKTFNGAEFHLTGDYYHPNIVATNVKMIHLLV